MSDQANIFQDNQNQNGGNPSNTQDGAGTSSNVSPDQALLTQLNEIKNERGEPKYRSLQDAIVALKHSQEYIPSLTSQLAQRDSELLTARAEAARVAELERAVTELTQRNTDTGKPPTAGMTPEQIAELVSRQLTERETNQTVAQNISQVRDAAVAAFGNEAQKKYEDKAAELGMTVAELNALAAKSPKAVLGMLGATVKQSPSNIQGTVNTAAFQPHQDSFVGRNTTGVIVGATSQDQREESRRAMQMVNELHAAGRSVYDLTDPKEYFKHFGK